MNRTPNRSRLGIHITRRNLDSVTRIDKRDLRSTSRSASIPRRGRGICRLLRLPFYMASPDSKSAQRFKTGDSQRNLIYTARRHSQSTQSCKTQNNKQHNKTSRKRFVSTWKLEIYRFETKIFIVETRNLFRTSPLVIFTTESKARRESDPTPRIETRILILCRDSESTPFKKSRTLHCTLKIANYMAPNHSNIHHRLGLCSSLKTAISTL